jgi:hypothetical protein
LPSLVVVLTVEAGAEQRRLGQHPSTLECVGGDQDLGGVAINEHPLNLVAPAASGRDVLFIDQDLQRIRLRLKSLDQAAQTLGPARRGAHGRD